MDNGQIRPVIVRAVLLDRQAKKATGRILYAFLILDRVEGCILERLASMRSLRDVVAFVIEYRRQHYGLPRISFDPPDGVDHDAGKVSRRYEALELLDIFYASSALGQS